MDSDSQVERAPENLEEVNWLDVAQRKVAGLRYGTVQIVVHNGKVVQIECTERVRLDRPDRSQQFATRPTDAE